MSKRLVITSLMALCMFLIVCMSATAAEPEDLSGNWALNIKWTDPPSDWLQYPVIITMDTPFSGTIEIEGNVGPLINIIILVVWSWEIPDLKVTYRGIALGGFMLGSMSNTLGQKGIWWAVRAAAGAASSGDASVLIKAPQ